VIKGILRKEVGGGGRVARKIQLKGGTRTTRGERIGKGK